MLADLKLRKSKMKFSPIFFLIVPAIHASNNYCKNGMCEKVSLSHATNKKQNFTLVGYVIETFSSFGNWKQCFNVCLKNCQCLSFNFNEVNTTENCELNDANTKLEPEALRKKEGVGYYELVRSYNDMKGVSQQTCPDSECHSNCCHSALCQNGGKCRDVCHANKRRYDCTCPVGFWGHRCQFKVRSCRDVLLGHETKPNGLYSVFDQDDILFQAYCDFDSEPNFAWTLIMSYSFQNRGAFMQKPFYLYDMEINQNAHQWDRYRLSLPRMQSIRNSSTHWRATCNFATKIMDFRDYIRTSFANIDFLVTPDANRCIWYEFVDIRDNRCQNCTVFSPYSSFNDYHIDSWWGNFCDFTARTGGVWNEDNFGFYGSWNSAFGCSSSDTSTTQYWIGGHK